MSRLVDRTGLRYGRLLVIERGPTKEGRRNAYWWCLCDCGVTTLVSGDSLKAGNTQSCGCLQRERACGPHPVHNLSYALIYNIKTGIIGRCHNTNDKRYKDYGGRGIVVCDEWRYSPTAFFEWADKSGYKKGLTIDRIDNDKGYCPENCRWVSNTENQNNKRNTRWVTLNGKTVSVTKWSRILELKSETIRSRLRRGWSDEDALTRPLELHKRKSEVGM